MSIPWERSPLFLNYTGLASGLIYFELYKTACFAAWDLKMGLSYHIILMYYHNYEHTGL